MICSRLNNYGKQLTLSYVNTIMFKDERIDTEAEKRTNKRPAIIITVFCSSEKDRT